MQDQDLNVALLRRSHTLLHLKAEDITHIAGSLHSSIPSQATVWSPSISRTPFNCLYPAPHARTLYIPHSPRAPILLYSWGSHISPPIPPSPILSPMCPYPPIPWSPNLLHKPGALCDFLPPFSFLFVWERCLSGCQHHKVFWEQSWAGGGIILDTVHGCLQKKPPKTEDLL